MDFKVKEFTVLTPFAIKAAEVQDNTNGNVIKISGYCNWSGKDDKGKTYIDLAGDIVVPGGVDTSVWEMNPQILWQHMRDETIGKGLKLEKREDGLYIEAEVHGDAMSPQDFYRVKSGLVCMFSIGFRTMDCEYKEMDGKDVFFITKSLLLEVSVVSIPCNSKSSFSVIKTLGEGLGFYGDRTEVLGKEESKQINEKELPMIVKAKHADLLSAAELEQAKSLGLDVEAEREISLVDLIKRLSAPAVDMEEIKSFIKEAVAEAVAALTPASPEEASTEKGAEEVPAEEEAPTEVEPEVSAEQEIKEEEVTELKSLVADLKAALEV